MRTFAVVGAGITGLVAARHLAASGAEVCVLEASDRAGGQLRATEIAGTRVDVGAEAFHTGAPEVLHLLDGLGLTNALVAARSAPTWLWTDRGLRPLPEGVGPAGPTRLWPVLTSRVLSPAGIMRAGLEPFVPSSRTQGDVAVGDYLQRRFGRQVTDRLVDPLLGGLHSGDVRRLSLTSATPMLAALAGQHRSLLLRRRAPAPTGPAFVAVRGGMTAVTSALLEQIGDVEVRRGVAVRQLQRDGGRTAVHTTDGDRLLVDGVVLALPAHAAARVVASACPPAATGLRRLRAASVAVTVLAYPASAADVPALSGTGMLVPSTARDRVLKAATFLSSKWPHLAGDHVLVRASAGRIDDDRVTRMDDRTLVDRLHEELCEATGLEVDPVEARVQRWPTTMPQLEVWHRERVDGITAELATDLPGVALAGSAYAGPGIASCLRSATAAAEQLLAAARPVRV